MSSNRVKTWSVTFFIKVTLLECSPLLFWKSKVVRVLKDSKPEKPLKVLLEGTEVKALTIKNVNGIEHLRLLTKKPNVLVLVHIHVWMYVR